MSGALRVAGLVLAATLMVLLPRPAQAQTGELSEVGERTFAQVAGCAASSENLLVSMVVDESSSLRSTDPQNRRVDAITTAVDSLAGLQASSAGRVSVEANLATFGAQYTELVPWGAVAGAHADRLLRSAAEDLPARSHAAYTDYRAALRGAQHSLQSRAAALTGTTCTLLLLFTDGELDVPGSERAAMAELCDPQGLVDGLRGAHIPIIAVALFADTGPGAVGPRAREELRAVAEGSGAGTACGAQPVASDAAPGAYLRADQPAALRRLFAGIGARIEGGRSSLSVLCPGPGCPDGALSIPLDRGVAGFRAVLDTAAGTVPRLLAPDGSGLELRTATTTLRGAKVLVTSRDGLTTVSVTYGAGAPAAGVWTLEPGASSQAPAVVDLYYFWGVTLTVGAPDGVVVGEPSRVDVSVRFTDGTPVDPAAYRSLDLAVTAGGTPVPLGALRGGVASGALTVPAGGAAAVELSAVASAASAPSGIALGPVSVTSSLTASLPPAFPRLKTSRLHFPDLVGQTSATSDLVLTGSDRGATRACFEPGMLRGPTTAGRIAVTSAHRCVDIPAGERLTWPFELAAGAPADGHVDGTIGVSLTAVGGGPTARVEVPVDAGMARPVDEPLRWGLTAALVALALALPCVIAWVGNAVVARFAVGPRTRVASVPVELAADGLHPGGGRASLFTPDDFGYLPAAERRAVTNLDAAGLHFYRRLPLQPFQEPVAWVRSTSGELVASTDRREPWSDDGRRARARFGLGSLLYLALSADPDPAGDFHGRLVSVAEDTDGLGDLLAAQQDQVAASSAVWEEVHRRLHDAATERDAALQGALAGAVGPGLRGRAGPPGADARAPGAGGTAADAAAPGVARDAPLAPRPPLWDDDAGTTGTPSSPADRARRGDRAGPPPGGDDDDGPPPSLFDD
ncbi:VWA domain-containing protein [Georgenia sp. SYP-B2076]|uniref:vWA domain-containing protein n=1 Tax=Georgenia sp. SYP-B2076 TaxID=2495881 RepID=UPI000F8DA12B|nr:VWA domain-containing protein [Georgenia sp. SYP-B2076]